MRGAPGRASFASAGEKADLMRIHSHPALLTALVVLLTGSGAAGGAPAEEADPSSSPATSVAIPMGNAFADGFSGRIADENDKITFAPGDMTAPQQVADEGSGSFAYGYDF